MNSEVSLNTSLLSDSFASFPATPNAEDFFKNLPKSATPDVDIESSSGACISNTNDCIFSAQPSFICTNPGISYSSRTQTVTNSSTGNPYLLNADFQNGNDRKLFVPPSLINRQMCGPSVLEEPLDVRYDSEGCSRSSNSSQIATKGTSDKSFFTILVGNSELPTDSPPVSCSSSFHVSSSSDHQMELSVPLQQRASIDNACKGNSQSRLHKEISATKRTDLDKCPNLAEDCEVGVLPPDLCLFEVVSMLKCSQCDDVFPDTASLINHYQKSHVAGHVASPVRINVDTADNAMLQKNHPVVVCHKCGSKVPSSVLQWYVSKVRGKVPGRKKKVQPSSETSKAPPSASSEPGSPASNGVVHVRCDEVQASPDGVTTEDARNWAVSLSPAYGSPESCDDASHPRFIGPASLPDEHDIVSHTVAREVHCLDESSDLSEEESVVGDGDKKGESRDGTMQVYVLDVLGGTTEHKVSQGSGDARQKRLVRPPAKLTDDEALPVALQTPPKIHKCSTKGCRLRFSSPELRDLHHRCHRPAGASGSPFICPFCSFTMKKWYSVQRHLWQVHQHEVDMLRCSECSSYRVHNEHSLRIHLETHASVKAYPCQTCGLRFRQLSQLLNHNKTHRSEKEQQQLAVQCPECGKPCCNKRQLSRHLKSVHEKVCLHRCALCPYATNRPADLRSHKRRHAKEKSFECCVCEMRFCDKTSQRRHLLRHLPLSLLQCPLCSFHTSRPQHFSSHFSALHPPQQQHQTLSFECKLCGEKCSSVRQYCSHSRTHHSDLLQQLIAQHPPASKPA